MQAEFDNLRRTYQALLGLTTVNYAELVQSIQGRLRDSSLFAGLLQINVTQSNLTVAQVVASVTNSAALRRVACTTLGDFEPVQCDSFLNGTQDQCYCVDLLTGHPMNTVSSKESACPTSKCRQMQSMVCF